MRAILFVTLLLINLWFIHCSTPSKCGAETTCDTCFGVAGCAWCKKLSHKSQRCNIIGQHASDGCSGGDILEAKSSLPKIITSAPITKTMRITPQKYHATLAVEKEVSFKLSYKDTTDKPLDLYYVLDLSYTMKDDKDTVSKQAEHLVTELKRITSDVQLGFGAFIDKPVLPFVASSQLRENSEYDIPYGFRNWLSLTNDTRKFSRAVNNAKISRNLDEPEGTLDALMQAIVCKEIGWRSSARKLIVVATDGPFHIAGDGKLGGIVRPNDMKCHMDKDGMYTHSKILDYPSIGEINAVILQHKVYVIFAVSYEETVYNLYKELQNHISQSTAEQLNQDSSNVVQKIKKKYEEISKKVELSVAKKPDFVDVEVYAKCSTSGGALMKQMYCTDVNVGSQIEFEIRVKLNRCPKIKTDNEIIISFFELSDEETLKIELDYNCTCQVCEEDRNMNDNDLRNYCTGRNATKYISCGTCICQDGRYGSVCQCSKDGENEQATITSCENRKTRSVCSDRGECKCGICECHKGFNGKHCEYSTDGCQRNRNGQTSEDSLCSERGECDKGKCVCYNGFQGKLCECEKSKEVGCIEPGKPLNSPICNGHGTCDCQQYQCKCNTGYGGLYCGVCKVNCPETEKSGSRCQDEFIQKCVRCQVQSRQKSQKKLEEKCNELCDPKNYKQISTKTSSRADVSTIQFNERNSVAGLSDVDGTECRLKISDEPCYSIFKYSYQRSSPGTPDVLQVYFTHDGVTCAKEPPFVWYILGVIASVLLLGIFSLLIWKLATHIHDTREFQRFEKETKHARWGTGDNPLYETPRSEFQNPAYRE